MSARSFLLPAAVLAGLAAVLGGLTPPARRAAAQPPDAPVGPRYVPADAAGFVHADGAGLWGSPVAKQLRAADAKTFGELADQAKTLFGVTPDDLRAVTAFWPKLKGPQDAGSAGVVLTFKTKVDQEKLEAGIKKLAEGLPVTVRMPDDRTAVLLVGRLGDEYAKPRPAGEAGPLAEAVKEAASGKYLVVVGATPANLPDEILADEVPDDIKPFQPLARTKSVVGLVSLGKELTVEARVTADTPARAVEAEKALGMLVKIMQEGLARGLKEVGEGVAKEPELKDVLTLLKAADAGLKGATFETTGSTTRAVARFPADLPFAGAWVAGVRKVREAATRAQSSNNLKQIALAMHNYHDTYGAFPPAAVVDKDGKPLLSWRVLILPFVEQEALYKEFKLDEPWDSEHNKKLLAKMPKLYALPEKAGPDETRTYYRVFVGKGAAFDLLQGVKIPAGFPDGTSNTIMAVTAAEAVPWTKPDDLPFDPEKDMTKLLGFFSSDVCMVAFVDGSVRALHKKLAPKTLSLLIQRDDGMVIDDPDF